MTKSTETIVIEETPVTEPTPGKFKKHLTLKNAAIAVGSALAITAGVIWFAVKRSDEEDFEDELAKFETEIPTIETPETV